MAIVKLDKLTVYGLARQRDQVVEQLQRLGCLHLIPLQIPDVKNPEHPNRGMVHEALKYLNACPVQNPNQHSRYTPDCDCLDVARQTLENRHRRQELNDERDYLLRSIRTLEPWGDFRLPAEQLMGGLQLWFYTIRRRQLNELERSDLVWQVVREDNQFVYVVVVSGAQPVGMPGNRVELDQRPLSELRARLEQVDEELEALHWQRVALTRWTTLLSRDLDEADDELARRDALNQLAQDGDLFALQGWAPRSTVPAVEDLARQHQLALVVEPPTGEDAPPTLLKNPQLLAGAEGAVTFYITPAYRSWDPTWVMFFSFSFFFAMIMSDAAYGLLLAGGLLLVWRKLSGSDSNRRFRNLALALVVATVIYGVLIGSWFGLTPPGLDRLQLKLDGRPLVENRDAMMILAISIGVLHLVLANLITAWRYWGRSQALSSIGWAAVLLGGLIFGLSWEASSRLVRWLAEVLGQASADVQAWLQSGGKVAVIGGLLAVVLFSSSRPLFTTRAKDWLWRLLDGLQGLTNISKAFGDTLSYLRLFALGLASAQLAVTFNDLAKGALEIPGLGILLAILILVAGHGINILLGIMGGVVHGLRLNCIEFFNWSLTDEGYPFRAFCKKAGS